MAAVRLWYAGLYREQLEVHLPHCTSHVSGRGGHSLGKKRRSCLYTSCSASPSSSMTPPTTSSSSRRSRSSRTISTSTPFPGRTRRGALSRFRLLRPHCCSHGEKLSKLCQQAAHHMMRARSLCTSCMALTRVPAKPSRRELLPTPRRMVRYLIAVAVDMLITTVAGFSASIGTLDSAAGHLPTDGPVAIVTASFEGGTFVTSTTHLILTSHSGQPADNAAHFVEWINSLQGPALTGVTFAVFGCGNRDWALTYQRIPTLCDDTLAGHGGSRLITRGEGDAGSSDLFQSFEKWEADLWAALRKVNPNTMSKHYRS